MRIRHAVPFAVPSAVPSTAACAAVFAAALLGPAAVLAAQENVRAVPPGREVREAKLLSPGLTDVWTLRVEAGEMLWCTVESGAFDPVLAVFDADGKRLAENDGEGTRSELFVQAACAGPVEVRVRGFQGAGGGHYAFALERFHTEPLAANGEAVHRFGPEQWWHWRVPLRAGDVLVPHAADAGRVTGVFDAARTFVAERHGTFTAPHDGEYVVRVEGNEGATCRLTTQLARRRTLAPGATAADATPAFGCDVWRVPLRAGTAGVVELAMPGPQLELALHESAPGEAPAVAWPRQLDKGGLRRRFLLARRDCELEVWLIDHAGADAPYRLTCAVPTAELPVGELPVGDVPADAAGGRSLALGAGDLFALDRTAGDLVRLQVESAQFDACFDVWDPDGNVIAQCVDDRAPLDRDAERTLLLPRTGRYRVLVYSPGGGGSGAYTVRADAVHAPRVQPGVPLRITVPPGDAAYAQLVLQRGDEVWLAARSRAFGVALAVIAPDGSTFVQEGGGRGGDVLAAYVAAHAGTHTLVVHGRGGSGEAELRVIGP